MEVAEKFLNGTYSSCYDIRFNRLALIIPIPRSKHLHMTSYTFGYFLIYLPYPEMYLTTKHHAQYSLLYIISKI